MSESAEFSFDQPRVVDSENPFDNIAKKSNTTKVLTKHNLIDPEPDSHPKKARIIAQQDVVEDIDNAPDVTEYLKDKVTDLKAEQVAKIRSHLEEINEWRSIGLKLDPDMLKLESTIVKLDNKEAVPHIPIHMDPKRVAHSNVTSPYEVMVTKVLGKSRIQKRCFGCHNGIGMPNMNSKITDSFEKFVIDTFLQIDWIAAAQQCADYYKQYVQGSVDPLDEAGSLPDWTARDIYDHMKEHQMHEPIKRRMEIMQLEEIMNVVYNNSIFTVNSEILKIAHRHADVADIEIDRDAVKLWSSLLTQRTRLAEGDPKKFLYKNERAADEKIVPPMTKKIGETTQLTLPSLFKTVCG